MTKMDLNFETYGVHVVVIRKIVVFRNVISCSLSLKLNILLHKNNLILC